MRKLLVKVVLFGTIAGVLALSGINIYKQYNLNKKVPSKITAKHQDVIYIDGVIFDNKYRRVAGQARKLWGQRKLIHMPGKTEQLISMVKLGKKHIYLDISSGGGLMNVGMKFVKTMNAAQNRGVKFTCIVRSHAMSMALIIFSECDERYGLFNSKVMWHSIAMTGTMRLNQFNADRLFKYMLAKNEEVWANTRKYFWPSYFVEHFEKETILDSSEVEQEAFVGNYLRVIDNFIVTGKPKPVLKKKKVNVKSDLPSKLQYEPRLLDQVLVYKGFYKGCTGKLLNQIAPNVYHLMSRNCGRLLTVPKTAIKLLKRNKVNLKKKGKK